MQNNRETYVSPDLTKTLVLLKLHKPVQGYTHAYEITQSVSGKTRKVTNYIFPRQVAHVRNMVDGNGWRYQG